MIAYLKYNYFLGYKSCPIYTVSQQYNFYEITPQASRSCPGTTEQINPNLTRPIPY